MREYRLICLLLFCFVSYSSSTLVDGIVTMSWSLAGSLTVIDRFLFNNTHIQFKIVCRESSVDASVTREQIERKFYKLDKRVKDTNIQIRGRIGRIIGCLPLRSDPTSTTEQDKNKQTRILQTYYELLWKQTEQRTFTIHQSNSDYSGKHLYINQSLDVQKSKTSRETAIRLRENLLAQTNRYKRIRRAAADKSLSLVVFILSSREVFSLAV